MASHGKPQRHIGKNRLVHEEIVILENEGSISPNLQLFLIFYIF